VGWLKFGMAFPRVVLLGRNYRMADGDPQSAGRAAS
jgi:hypothetical protein